MSNDKQEGMIMLELLTTFGFILVILFTLLPILLQIRLEQNVLMQQRLIQSALHDEIQLHSTTVNPPTHKVLKLENITVSFKFYNDLDPIIKGRATWINAKGEEDQLSLYYYR